MTRQRFVGGAIDEALAEGFLVARITRHQGAVGDDVDQARDAARALVQRAQSQARERNAHIAGDRHAMAHVGFGLGGIQRREVIARGDALRQLPQLPAGEHVAQFGLADQDDLQQFLGRRLQIGQQADLFQRLVGKAWASSTIRTTRSPCA